MKFLRFERGGMKMLLLFSMLFSFFNFTNAQNIFDTLNVQNQDVDTKMAGQIINILVDDLGLITSKDHLKTANFHRYDHNKRNHYARHNFWLSFTIKNSGESDTLKFWAFFGKHLITNVFYKKGSQAIDTLADWRPHGKEPFNKSKFFIPVLLPKNQAVTYWIKIDKSLFFDGIKLELLPMNTSKKWWEEVDFKETKLFGFISMVFGLFLFTGIIAAFQSIFIKDKTYFYWAIYLFANSLFFLAELNRVFALWIVPSLEDPAITWAIPWPSAIQFLVSITYLLFLNSFLEIHKQNPRIFRIINISIILMSVFFSLSVYFIFPHKAGQSIYADILLVPSNLMILATVILIIKSPIPQKNLIMAGSVGVLVAASISIILELTEMANKFGFWFIPIVCYGLGAVWELALFSLALSQRTKLIQHEAQLMQKNYTYKLEQELSQRLELIQTKDRLLEEQRINTLTTEFEQKIAETEITALRSQMNPHFIFNCLNSIKLYSLENDSDSASVYLTKFSKLIRLVLDNSRSERLTLEKEIETLRLYIEMEIMRFKEKVTYEMIISPEIDLQYVEIPPLLIQPFVENAIWHGLMHKEFGGKVSILVNLLTENMLEIQIVDNGVGRDKSAEYKSKTATKHKSFGMKVTNERIELINQIYKTDAKVEIEDLYDDTKCGIGTKVTIQIPI